jgi:hypothetical protein
MQEILSDLRNHLSGMPCVRYWLSCCDGGLWCIGHDESVVVRNRGRTHGGCEGKGSSIRMKKCVEDWTL